MTRWDSVKLASIMPMMMTGCLVLLSHSSGAQVPQTQAETATADDVPRLDVASIRSSSRDGMSTVMFTPDGIYFARVPTQMLVQRAFGVAEDRVLGLPAWAKSDSYVIQARVDNSDLARWEDLPSNKKRIALIRLLTTRYGLKFHHETKVLSVLSLTVDRKSSKLRTARPSDTYANGVQGPDGPRGGGTIWSEPGKITGQGVPIGDLVALLSFRNRLGYPIVDRTGLTGKYDFVLLWNEDPAMSTIPTGATDAPDVLGPSIFTACREELGLVVKVQKLPSDVIVIDHIEKPSEN